MRMGKVIGTLVSSIKEDSLRGIKLLLIQLEEEKTVLVAADASHVAGYGDRVYIMTSKEGSDIMDMGRLPVDAAVAGIVDEAYLA